MDSEWERGGGRERELRYRICKINGNVSAHRSKSQSKSVLVLLEWSVAHSKRERKLKKPVLTLSFSNDNAATKWNPLQCTWNLWFNFRCIEISVCRSLQNRIFPFFHRPRKTICFAVSPNYFVSRNFFTARIKRSIESTLTATPPMTI